MSKEKWKGNHESLEEWAEPIYKKMKNDINKRFKENRSRITEMMEEFKRTGKVDVSKSAHLAYENGSGDKCE